MGAKNMSLLSRLQRVVKKVKILLNLNMNRWRVAKMLGVDSSRRLMSFNDRPGLRGYADFESESEDSFSSSHNNNSNNYNVLELHRTISFQSDDDVDRRAELFIENFRRQLQIERQISLELKYLQDKAASP